MADGVTDWTVSVTSDDNNNVDNTLHINAVKSGTAVSSDSYTVDLGDSQIVSADTFATILAENATKDVIIKSNNNVTFTFAKGTMASVDGKTEYDFSTSINSVYADTMPSYITRIILYRRLTLIIQASYREQQTSASMQEQSMQVRPFIIHL